MPRGTQSSIPSVINHQSTRRIIATVTLMMTMSKLPDVEHYEDYFSTTATLRPHQIVVSACCLVVLLLTFILVEQTTATEKATTHYTSYRFNAMYPPVSISEWSPSCNSFLGVETGNTTAFSSTKAIRPSTCLPPSVSSTAAFGIVASLLMFWRKKFNVVAEECDIARSCRVKKESGRDLSVRWNELYRARDRSLFSSMRGGAILLSLTIGDTPRSVRKVASFVTRTSMSTRNRWQPIESNPNMRRTTGVSTKALPATALATSTPTRTGNSRNSRNPILGNSFSDGSPPIRYLVIVESPSKCETIRKILQGYTLDQSQNPKQNNVEYKVVSCRGHIRNLPSGSSGARGGPKTQRKGVAKEKEKRGKAGEALVDSHSTVDVSDSNSIDNRLYVANTEASKAKTFPYVIPGIDLYNNYQPTYEVIPGKESVVIELRQFVAQADKIYLATDPDREGEAMAWHLAEVLGLVPLESQAANHDGSLGNEKKHINVGKPFQRITFTEITSKAITQAIENPLRLNLNLVEAQETRRLLDRLAGFTVTPLLWRKIAGGLSAGRCQSVALQIVVQRERQRLSFESTQYSSVLARFGQPSISTKLYAINGTIVATSGTDFTAQGQQLQPESKHKLHLTSEWTRAIVEELMHQMVSWQVIQVQSKTRQLSPPSAYRTSTLQQDANRQLGMSVQQTMRTAQQLYEQGLISYMRTDSTHLSDEAEMTIEQSILSMFGTSCYGGRGNNAPAKGRKKSTKKSSFAQEAHEAIRPAIQPNGQFAQPDEIESINEAKALYTLIYRRTLASRMKPQVSNQTRAMIEGVNADRQSTAHFCATGSVVLSPGYTIVYGKKPSVASVSSQDELNTDDEGNDNLEVELELPQLVVGQQLKLKDMIPRDHQTQPPPRYTEASIVKELESLGVGRPSTYAGIVQILRDRAYVVHSVNQVTSNSPLPGGSARKKTSGQSLLAQRAAGRTDLATGGGAARGPLVPSLSAFAVCSLLEKHCPDYVDPQFTSRMEERLDQIACRGHAGNDDDNGGDDDDDAEAKSGRTAFGDERVAYLNEFYAGETGLAAQVKRIDESVSAEEARRVMLPTLQDSHGENNTEDSSEIGVFVGPWGPFVQPISNGVPTKRGKGASKPPSVALPPALVANISAITPSKLRALLSSKQEGGLALGSHPDDGRLIRIKTGPYGAYLQWGNDGVEGTTRHSLPRHLAAEQEFALLETEEGQDPNDSETHTGITLEEAIGYVGLPRTVTTLNDLPIVTGIGPYGPYLKYNNTFVPLKTEDGDVLTVDPATAERLVQASATRGTGPGVRNVKAVLGEKDGNSVTIKRGRFGDYINWKKVNAKIPNEYLDDPATIPLEEAWSLVQEKINGSDAAKRPAASKGRPRKAAPLDPPMTTLSVALVKPKRPRSAYLFFCGRMRPEVSGKVNSLGEISKELARLWSETTDRSEYEILAAHDKDRYTREVAEYGNVMAKDSPVKAVSKPLKYTETTAEATEPKRPKSSYLFFCDQMRPQASKQVKSLGEISRELARMWSETLDRSDYERLAKLDKDRYEKETTKQKQLKGTIRNDSSIEEDSSRTGHPPRVRSPSAYMLFCRDKRAEMVGEQGKKIPFTEMTKLLAAAWKACDDDTRNRYQTLAAEEKMKLLLDESTN